jgi:hypothetical protein
LYYYRPENFALMIKVLDACDVNGRYWVFSSSTAGLPYTIQLTDSKSGESRRYESSPASDFQPIIDTAAFATCP